MDHQIKRFASRFLFGKPIATRDAHHHTIGPGVGLAVLASDNLSSVAYATEEILIVLAAVGVGSFSLSIPISIAIIVLLLLLGISYRQTIYAYPSGGGAYIVAKDNIGVTAAQTAGAALLMDYVLTVAVSISSGVDQIASVFPSLHGHQVAVCMVLIAFIMFMNLRGVKESGNIFAFPTYFFIVACSMTILIGLFRWATGSLVPLEGVEMIQRPTTPLTLFLILKAFSSGCTAVTGVEAISNGITIFREPRSKNAAKTLTMMACILGVFFLGITFLAQQIQAVPSETETVISQVGRAIYGQGIPYQLLMAGTTIILVMAANTSYADFPRLCALHAGDGFLPRQLAYKSSRLVFSWGIVFLSFASALLIFLFNAHTSSLIPLYCIGVFMSFTLSQFGMVLHWQKIGKGIIKPLSEDANSPDSSKNWRLKQAINAVGALVSGIVTIIFATTKFSSGAWVTVILIPGLVYIFYKIHDHYRRVEKFLTLPWKKAEVLGNPNMKTIILIDDVNYGTLRMVQFAKSIGHPWMGLHVNFDNARAAQVKKKWDDMIGEGEIKLISSPFRFLLEPVIKFITRERDKLPNGMIHVITGQLVVDGVFPPLLHSKNARGLLEELQKVERVIVTPVPFHLDRGKDLNRLHS